MPHPRNAPSVQPLKTLHQELDVADPAANELYIEPGASAPRRQFLIDAVACGGHRFHRAEIQGGGVDQRLDKLQKLAARIAIAGGNARLDEHLNSQSRARVR
jgi:hypothetical protein